MDAQYWKGRWERGETGWHQSEVEPRLIERFGELKPTRVLVPLCGKSLDLAWLASRGHEVVGVEVSEMAIRAFFAEHGLACERAERAGLVEFRGGGVSILNADVFAVTATHVGRLGAIYDRAALIALPRDKRAAYAAHLTALARACAGPELRFLQIALERANDDGSGPPFTVTSAELERLYSPAFRVEFLGRESVDLGPDRPRADECVYELRLA